jgi:DNA-directed RNA polymerase subunit RPC12/RpoP
MNKTVIPMELQLNLWWPFLLEFGIKPRAIIKCGECGYEFKTKILPLIYPKIECPFCLSLNQILINFNQ